ncbi:MAG: hypothetical protein JO257_13295 [Deltaproteobacteria bacterium]|nr:hypothetical protein [Deltaproteobacteria bacterium]
MRVRMWPVAVVFALASAGIAAAALSLGSDISIDCARQDASTTSCHIVNQHGTGPMTDRDARDLTLPADVTVKWDTFSSRRGEEEELVADSPGWRSPRTIVVARDGSVRLVGDRLAAHARDPASASFSARIHGHGRRWYLLGVALFLGVLAIRAAVGTRVR